MANERPAVISDNDADVPQSISSRDFYLVYVSTKSKNRIPTKFERKKKSMDRLISFVNNEFSLSTELSVVNHYCQVPT